MVTIKDIAAKAGVSCGTVTFALRGPSKKGQRDISAARRQEILKIAKEMGWRPNRSARFLQEGKTGIIAVIFPEQILTSWTWRQSISLTLEVIQGIQEELDRHEYEAILLMPTQEQTERVLRKKILDERRVDGVVLFGDPIFGRFLPEILAHKIPVISFWKEAQSYGIPVITVNVDRQIEEMVIAAHSLGHRRAGCIFSNVERKDVFVKKCRVLGMTVQETACGPINDEVAGALATQQALNRPDRPTLLFYTSDHLAAAGISAATGLGLRVPEDLSVVGVDNAPCLPTGMVPLATIGIPFRERGALAARILMDSIRGQKTPAKVFTLDGSFIPRQSLGPVPPAIK